MASTPQPDLAALATTYADTLCAAFPVVATQLGRHDHDHRLGELDPAALSQLVRDVSAIRSQVTPALDAANADTRADARALDGVMAVRLLEWEEDQQWRRNPDQAIETCLGGCFALLLRDFAPVAERLDALTSRLGAVPAYLESARAVWSDVPTIWAQGAAESAAAGATFFRDDLVAAMSDGDDRSARAALEAAAKAADALDATAAHLATLGRDDAPWKAGEDRVARRLRHEHHLPDSPATMERRGLALVEETLELLNTTDPSWRASVTRLKHDHPAAPDLVAAYRDEMQRAREFVIETRLAPTTDAPLDVRPTPQFWAHLLPYAAYDPPGFFEHDQTGIFWVTVPEGPGAEEQLKGHFRHAITVTAVHEGFPGHHQQLTQANAAGNLLRCLADSSLTIEGWAFYCEQMLWEQGYYGNDVGLRISQLKDQLWRAARVVLDMRLHCGDLTVDEAVDYLVDVADLERDNAIAEVLRYTSTPTYQISYAIGKAEILALRDTVQKIQRDRFDIASFHADLLGFGNLAVPLSAEALLARIGSGA
jgi:uncharacterized protein (DUF885 family)